MTKSLIEGAKNARGLTVIIDVFRAFTTAAYVMNNGAKRIIPIGMLQEAFELKKSNLDSILMGERGGLKVDGFDYGNSPSEIKNLAFTGKTVIMTTSAGTQGIVNAKHANGILLGNFVCAHATTNYIRRVKPKIITLVAMGESGIEKSDEDDLCAEYIKKLLNGENPNFTEIRDYLRNCKSTLKYFDKTRPEFPGEDFYCAMDLDRFKFILRVVREDNNRIIVKEG